MNVIGLDAEREANCRRLAHFLLSDMVCSQMGFDMFQYCAPSPGELAAAKRTLEMRNLDPHESLHACGTVGCALGHGPLAGIPVQPHQVTWQQYLENFICCGLFDSRERLDILSAYATWLFNSNWHVVDNSPAGAGKRILWLLDRGLPVDWQEQMFAEVPLCYADWQPELPAVPAESVLPEQELVLHGAEARQ